MKPLVLFLLASLIAGIPARAAEKLVVSVSNDLPIARPSETIAVPWSKVNEALPHALIQHITVKDSSGHPIPFQVTNLDPTAKDPGHEGLAYGELLFQHDFAAGEKSAAFTVEKIEELSPVFASKVFARFVPERLDDFAWENDKVAHRTYGQALEAPAPAGSGKEVLRSSGLDVWCKRVSYPIVDRWYNIGHDHYHVDEGEGMDMYQVGPSRGCGGTGIWSGGTLYVSHNYKSWRIIANGPIRAIFELTYEAWPVGAIRVSEVKRFTVDAGHYLDQIESTFTVEGASEATVAIGLNKNSADQGQDDGKSFTANESQGWLAQWEREKVNGSIGEAVIVDRTFFRGFADDSADLLVLAAVKSGQALHYQAGAGWTGRGEFSSKDEWYAYVADCASRMASPVKISLSSSR